jgi:hypothetical protein
MILLTRGKVTLMHILALILSTLCQHLDAVEELHRSDTKKIQHCILNLSLLITRKTVLTTTLQYNPPCRIICIQ